MAPPVKITDPEVIRKLMDLRTIDQVPWKELPAHYKELTGGEEANWQTIRSTLRREAPMDFLPARVSEGIRLIIEEKQAEVYDVFRLTLVAFNVRFAEYMALVGKQRLAELDKAVPEEEKDGAEVAFTPEDLARMDLLYNDMLSFSFRFAGILREMGGVGQHEMAQGMGINAASATVEEVADEALAIEATIERVVAKVALVTSQELEAINAAHAVEVRGHHRVLPSVGEDLVEENG